MFKKYQSVEKAKVLSPASHRLTSKLLRKTGKRSISDLTEEERKKLTEALENS